MGEKDKEKSKDLVSHQDRDVSAIKAGLKLIPGVGESISQLIFGKLEEAENRRLRETLEEIKENLEEKKREPEIQGEEYARLFLDASPTVASARSEDKRQRLRDLLFNSLFIPPGDPTWEESMHCLELLKEIDAVELYVIAVVATAQRDGQRGGLSEFSQPARWIFIHESVLRHIPNLACAPEGWFKDTKYNNILIKKSITSLVKDKQLIRSQDFPATSGSFSTPIRFYQLTPAGEMLVKWTMADF